MRDRPPQHGIQGAGRRLAGLLTVLLPLIAGAGLVRAEGDAGPAAAPAGDAGTPVERDAGAPGWRIYPPELLLDDARDRVGLLVVRTDPDGGTAEISSGLTIASEPPGLVRREGRFLTPAKAGEGRLVVRLGEERRSVPLTVRAPESRPTVTFRNHVLPWLTRSGCNTGACHGAARGKDGFRLSLFGFDPAGDQARLTRELVGRRINLAAPESSLLLEKGLGKVRHTGGKRFDKDSEAYATILAWIRAGAPADPKSLPAVTEVRLYPPEAVLNVGAGQRLHLRALYSDGTDRDVTRLAVFLSSNGHSVGVDGEGRVTALRRGEAFIMARFGAFTVGLPVIVRDPAPAGEAFSLGEPPADNVIDKLINRKLARLRIRPSGICDDRTFLRRVTIDIVGRLPTIAELKSFLADSRPDKRDRIIDALLERKEFAQIQVLKLAERLQIRSTQRVSPKAVLGYHRWLERRIADGVPFDAIVRELLTATGGTFEAPPTNYYELETNQLKIAENVAQVFLGMRIQCAQCHNHPFDRWTQDDYYGFAAFFAQIGRKRGADPRERIVFNRRRGEVRHPVSKTVVAPKFLGGATPDVKGKDRREVLAKWLTGPENTWFEQNLANIVWEHFFGIGIVHEVDDMRVSNPPSNPQLLAELGRRFRAVKFDFRELVRDICRSRAYQRSIVANETNALDQRNFARARVRRIRAEVLLDCLSQVTETTEKFRGLPRGSRAVEIADGRFSTHFLKVFGRPERESVCACELKLEPTLSQALHLINGKTVSVNIMRGQLTRRRLLKRVPPREIIKELSLRCLSREPTAEEWSRYERELDAANNTRVALDDIFWAILNSREFCFNH